MKKDKRVFIIIYTSIILQKIKGINLKIKDIFSKIKGIFLKIRIIF